ncbi:IS110 family transposase (plasmid) [Pseudarthrobacter sp. P1]|uniref:IS110 family transposase n=1 Tax=Pseudarthrobacter sp. P1 TaxID=3418418 RepID=UPI003CF6A540
MVRRGHGALSGRPEILATIPGVSSLVADGIIAETEADMSHFEIPGGLASWAGLSPAPTASAGRVNSTKTRPGNPYLKGALGVATLSAPATPRTATSGHV